MHTLKFNCWVTWQASRRQEQVNYRYIFRCLHCLASFLRLTNCTKCTRSLISNDCSCHCRRWFYNIKLSLINYRPIWIVNFLRCTNDWGHLLFNLYRNISLFESISSINLVSDVPLSMLSMLKDLSGFLSKIDRINNVFTSFVLKKIFVQFMDLCNTSGDLPVELENSNFWYKKSMLSQKILELLLKWNCSF